MNYTFDYSIGRLSRQTASGLGALITKKFKENKLEYDAKDWMYLSFIKNSTNLSQNELSAGVGFNKVMINRAMERLEKLEMLTRIKDEKDQRINRLRLTRNGQALYSKLKLIVEESLELVFEGVETEKKQQCIEVLESVLINIDAINQSKL